MPKYRATIERVQHSRAVVEFTATNIVDAAKTLQSYIVDYASVRNVVVVRSHDQDTKRSEVDTVVVITEREG